MPLGGLVGYLHKDFFCVVSDYVFFETASTAPYQIRRIEELNKVTSFIDLHYLNFAILPFLQVFQD